MNIDGIASNYGVDWFGGSAGRGGAAESGGGAGDTVTLSEEARWLAAESGGEAASGQGASGEYPVEAYSIPGWYADLFGGYNTVNAELGATWEESRTGYDRLDSADQRLFQEYSDILNDCFHEQLDRLGVSGDTGAYYNDFIKNSSNQTVAREAIYDSLQGNPRAVELMQYFGIEIG